MWNSTFELGLTRLEFIIMVRSTVAYLQLLTRIVYLYLFVIYYSPVNILDDSRFWDSLTLSHNKFDTSYTEERPVVKYNWTLLFGFAISFNLWKVKVATVSLFFNSFNFKRKKQSNKQTNNKKKYEKANQSHNSTFVELDYTMNVWHKTSIISSLAVTMAAYLKDYMDLLFSFQHW